MSELQDPLIRQETPKLDRQPGALMEQSDKHMSCWSPLTKTGFWRWNLIVLSVGLILLLFFLLTLFLEWNQDAIVPTGTFAFIFIVAFFAGWLWFQPDEDC